MERYRLTIHAEQDVIRIHQWGVQRHGEEKADAYFLAFFEHFQRLADNPKLYRRSTTSDRATDEAYADRRACTTVSTVMS